MQSAFDNKVICFNVTTTTFATLKLSMIIKHQKALGKPKKTRKQFSKNHKNLGTKTKKSKNHKNSRKTKKTNIFWRLGWTLCLPRFLCFFAGSSMFFLGFWLKTLEKQKIPKTNCWRLLGGSASPKTFRKMFFVPYLPREGCYTRFYVRCAAPPLAPPSPSPFAGPHLAALDCSDSRRTSSASS